jgi:hypothetical protein
MDLLTRSHGRIDAKLTTAGSRLTWTGKNRRECLKMTQDRSGLIACSVADRVPLLASRPIVCYGLALPLIQIGAFLEATITSAFHC